MMPRALSSQRAGDCERERRRLRATGSSTLVAQTRTNHPEGILVPRRFRVNAPAVASEIIDGEAVIMNLRSGAYFSTRGSGSLLWSWIEQGIAEDALLDALRQSFADADGQAAPALDAFLSQLLQHELIREIPLHGPIPAPEPRIPPPSRVPFAAPMLEVYTDMQDLLLLDPIHDVSEDEGWPAPK